jgi:hypothetical protein
LARRDRPTARPVDRIIPVPHFGHLAPLASLMLHPFRRSAHVPRNSTATPMRARSRTSRVTRPQCAGSRLTCHIDFLRRTSIPPCKTARNPLNRGWRTHPNCRPRRVPHAAYVEPTASDTAGRNCRGG